MQGGCTGWRTGEAASPVRPRVSPASEARCRGRDVIARPPGPLCRIRARHQVRTARRIRDPPPDIRPHAAWQARDGRLHCRPLGQHGIDARQRFRIGGQLARHPARGDGRSRAARFDVEDVCGWVAAGDVDPQHVLAACHRGARWRVRSVGIGSDHLISGDGLWHDRVVDQVRLGGAGSGRGVGASRSRRSARLWLGRRVLPAGAGRGLSRGSVSRA